MPVPVDRCDEVRRQWIAWHQHGFLFQKKRAGELARRIRGRAAELAKARPDAADDDVMHPLFLRPVTTPYAAVDLAVVVAAVIMAPIGWVAGRGVYRVTVQLIPSKLRSYPVAAFAWASVVTGLPVVLLYDPDPTALQTVVVPWLLGQLPATALAAGVYGILEGWLAVEGSRDWWPVRPPPAADVVDFGLALDDLPTPGVFGTSVSPPVGEGTPVPRERTRGRHR